jgi:hypothetical protein
MLSMTVSNGAVTGGVDTHSQTHHAAVIDHLGRPLGDREFPATPGGYRALLRWMRGHGQLTQVGIEGTGTYGLGLLRHLQTADMVVVEVDRPSRRLRATRGKSDPIDAYAAAHTALTRTRCGTPKTRDGIVEAIRALRITRRSAVKARTQTINQLKALLVSAPTALREDLRHLRTPALITACTALQVSGPLQDPGQAITLALHRLATRYQHLTNEITAADGELLHLVTAAAPDLIALVGVGVEVAGQLADHRWRQPRPDALRGRVRPPVRRRPDPRLQRQNPPPPTQPRRRPRRQQRPVHRRARPHPLRSPHPRLPRPPHRRGPDQARDHPLPQALPRPRDLPGAGHTDPSSSSRPAQRPWWTSQP